MADLDAASLSEFQDFFKKFYTPANAVLVIAGDIDIAKTRLLVENYFADIPAGAPVVKSAYVEEPITKEMIDDLEEQIHTNSKICSLKAKWYNKGIKFLLATVILWFVCMIFQLI